MYCRLTVETILVTGRADCSWASSLGEIGSVSPDSDSGVCMLAVVTVVDDDVSWLNDGCVDFRGGPRVLMTGK